MADRAKVNPERSLQESTGAPQPAPAASRAFARANAAVASTIGRLLEQCSRLYGYALLIAGIDSLFLAGVSSLPLTKWNDDGVPRADVVAVSTLLGGWISVASAALISFNVSAVKYVQGRPNPHHRERYAWSGGFVGAFGGSLFCIGSLTFAPAAVGVNPRFFLLDLVGLLLGVVVGVLLGNHLMRLQYVREHPPAEIESTRHTDVGSDRESKSSQGRGSTFTNLFVTITLTLGYPM